jgi:hypothetical protein
MDAERQRFTLRLTWRTVPIMFSMMLVHARPELLQLASARLERHLGGRA